MNGDDPSGASPGFSVSPKPTQPDLIFVTLIHQALRADGPRLQATVASLQRDDPAARVAGAREYFERYRDQLVAHHTHEDELFFPALAARVGADRMHRDELVSQHGELGGVLQEIGDGLAAMAGSDGDFSANRTRAAGALSTMVDHLTVHLDLEERTALPLVVSDMPVAEYAELEAKARKATPREQSAFMIPWLAGHATPEQRKEWFRTAPPLRIVERLNRGRYRRLEAALLPAG
jgi:hemerythrin-like domain-containing protein